MVSDVANTSKMNKYHQSIGVTDNSDEPAGVKASRKRPGVLRERRRPAGFGTFGALLLVTSLVQRSMAAGSGFQGSSGSRGGNSNAPPRPPSSYSNNQRGNKENGPPAPPSRGPRGALPPSMQTRVSRTPTEAGEAGLRPTAGARAGAEAARGRLARAAADAPSALDRRAVLEQRAGAGGGGSEGAFDPQEYREQQQQRRQQQQQEGQGFAGQEPWDATANEGNYDRDRDPYQEHDTTGMMAEGSPESAASPPPPRTPLQEQVHQHNYRSQRAQIPGQAVGTTQSPSSSLFRRAGSGGVFIIFVIMVCRSLNHYEYADQLVGAFRAISMVPAVGLFLGNLVCMCLSLVQSATNRQKARMKAMLTVDAACEALLLGYNMVLLLVGTSGLMPKEEFVSRILTNVLFMSLCFTFAKARWVADGAF